MKGSNFTNSGRGGGWVSSNKFKGARVQTLAQFLLTLIKVVDINYFDQCVTFHDSSFPIVFRWKD